MRCIRSTHPELKCTCHQPTRRCVHTQRVSGDTQPRGTVFRCATNTLCCCRRCGVGRARTHQQQLGWLVAGRPQTRSCAHRTFPAVDARGVRSLDSGMRVQTCCCHSRTCSTHQLTRLLVSQQLVRCGSNKPYPRLRPSVVPIEEPGPTRVADRGQHTGLRQHHSARAWGLDDVNTKACKRAFIHVRVQRERHGTHVVPTAD